MSAASITVSERPGKERSIDIDVLVSHLGAIPDAATVAKGRRGRAVPVRLIMATDQPFVMVSDEDGTYRACIPTIDLLHGGHLLVGTHDKPLTQDEGGPVRLIVVDGTTLCWNVKHVVSLRAIAEREPDSVPENPPH
jgi:DMSO/TMAO reductase YedYZ molybdopterin-dependent catalytic subunit